MSQRSRRKALRALCEKHYLLIKIDGEHWDTSAQEDIAEYFNEHKLEIARYAVVTRHDDVFYVKPCAYDLTDAYQRAMENINDSIFYEVPVEVVNLDTGQRWTPSWDSLTWAVKS